MRDYTKGIRKPPSAAHLCRLVGPTAEATAKRIIEFQDANIKIQTWRAVDFLTAYLAGGNYDHLLRQAKLAKKKNKHLGNAALETLPLVKQYKRDFGLDWFRSVNPISVKLSQNLDVHLKPMGLTAIDDQLTLVAGQVWKDTSLNPFSFRLWRSILKLGYLDNQFDVKGFHWLELSAPKRGHEREFALRTNETVEAFSDEEMNSIVKNIDQAMDIVRTVPPKKRQRKPDPKQGDFF